MNWDRIEGQWKQRRGKAVHHWGKLMNDDLAAIAGKHEQLVGMLQEKYGVAKEEAKKQVDEFKKIVGLLKITNSKLKRLQKSPRKAATSKTKKKSLKGKPKKRTTRK
jgi:uncharacterized protein YjbJ (UPF0337 family)